MRPIHREGIVCDLTCTDRRAELLARWRTMPGHLHAQLEDGTKVSATYDARQVDDTRLSSVRYLELPAGGAAPVALGCDRPPYDHEIRLSADGRDALRMDLLSDR